MWIKKIDRLSKVPGIGSAALRRLGAASVLSLDDFVARCASGEERETLASETGLPLAAIIQWGRSIELAGLSEISLPAVQLLQDAGVLNLDMLAEADLDELRAALQNSNRRIVRLRRVPPDEMLITWIEQAASLPRVLQDL